MEPDSGSINSSGGEDPYKQFYGYVDSGGSVPPQYYPPQYNYNPNNMAVHQDNYSTGMGSRNMPMGPQQNQNPPLQYPPSSMPNLGYGRTLPQDFLGNPLADVAMQYGTKLVGTGKEMVDKEINRFITVAKMRYFFSVDTHYVMTKLKMLMFPFGRQDWSLKYDNNSRVEPRYDHNAPDLYIPFMGYVTYVLLAGIVLGMKDMFSPEMLGILASQALAWTAVEIVLQLITIYFINIATSLTFLDLLAYSGYKFVGIIVCILARLLSNNYGYIISLAYCGTTTAFFMVQTLKWRLMSEPDDDWNDQPQTVNYVNVAYKRKMYFLIVIGLSHIIQIWWLSSCIDTKTL